MKQPSQGFTLLELLVVILLMGIMATLAMPSFIAFGERNALSAAVNQLQSTLAFARNTAITRRIEVTVCPADDDRSACGSEWSGELMVVKGNQTDNVQADDIVRVIATGQGTQVTYSRGWSRIRYSSLGFTSGYNGSFAICSGNGTEKSQGKKLVLSQLGRLRIDEAPIDC